MKVYSLAILWPPWFFAAGSPTQSKALAVACGLTGFDLWSTRRYELSPEPGAVSTLGSTAWLRVI